MKRILMVTVVLTMVLASVAAAFAASPYRMRVNIPFDFYAGDEKLPAGEYLVEMSSLGNLATGSTIHIRKKDGSGTQTLFATPRGDFLENHTTNCLIFNHYANAYFLSEVRHTGLESNLARSDYEKEMSVAQVKRPVTVAAARE